MLVFIAAPQVAKSWESIEWKLALTCFIKNCPAGGKISTAILFHIFKKNTPTSCPALNFNFSVKFIPCLVQFIKNYLSTQTFSSSTTAVFLVAAEQLNCSIGGLSVLLEAISPPVTEFRESTFLSFTRLLFSPDFLPGGILNSWLFITKSKLYVISFSLFLTSTITDSAHVPLCQGAGPGHQRGSAAVWEGALLRYRRLHHDRLQGDQGHRHTALQVGWHFCICRFVSRFGHLHN